MVWCSAGSWYRQTSLSWNLQLVKAANSGVCGAKCTVSHAHDEEEDEDGEVFVQDEDEDGGDCVQGGGDCEQHDDVDYSSSGLILCLSLHHRFFWSIWEEVWLRGFYEKGSSLFKLFWGILIPWEIFWVEIENMQRGRREKRHRRAIHFSLTLRGGGAQSVFSFKLHHSFNAKNTF